MLDDQVRIEIENSTNPEHAKYLDFPEDATSRRRLVLATEEALLSEYPLSEGFDETSTEIEE